MTILVATDFSDIADRALDEAIQLAQALGAQLEIVHVHPLRHMPLPPTLDVAVVSPRPKEVAEAETALAERGQRVASRGLQVATYSAFGAPADEVVRRADAIGARYIAVGRHGHNAITEALLGSVTERIVRQARVPVLMVPSLR